MAFPTHDLLERRRRRVANVVEEVAIRAEFGDDADWHVPFDRNNDANEADDVGMSKIPEQTQLLEVVLGEVPSDIGERNLDIAILALVAGSAHKAVSALSTTALPLLQGGQTTPLTHP